MRTLFEKVKAQRDQIILYDAERDTQKTKLRERARTFFKVHGTSSEIQRTVEQKKLRMLTDSYSKRSDSSLSGPSTRSKFLSTRATSSLTAQEKIAALEMLPSINRSSKKPRPLTFSPEKRLVNRRKAKETGAEDLLKQLDSRRRNRQKRMSLMKTSKRFKDNQKSNYNDRATELIEISELIKKQFSEPMEENLQENMASKIRSKLYEQGLTLKDNRKKVLGIIKKEAERLQINKLIQDELPKTKTGTEDSAQKLLVSTIKSALQKRNLTLKDNRQEIIKLFKEEAQKSRAPKSAAQSSQGFFNGKDRNPSSSKPQPRSRKRK